MCKSSAKTIKLYGSCSSAKFSISQKKNNSIKANFNLTMRATLNMFWRSSRSPTYHPDILPGFFEIILASQVVPFYFTKKNSLFCLFAGTRVETNFSLICQSTYFAQVIVQVSYWQIYITYRKLLSKQWTYQLEKHHQRRAWHLLRLWWKDRLYGLENNNRQRR